MTIKNNTVKSLERAAPRKGITTSRQQKRHNKKRPNKGPVA
jgi:hypothetical protein